MNILITGAGGFLGSALAIRFGDMNHQVFLLVRNKTDLYRIPNKTPFKIGRCETDQQINKFIADASPDVVIHAACSYGRNGEPLLQMIDSNVRFGALILDAIRDAGKSIFFINTGTVLAKDVNLYAQTKNQFMELGASLAINAKYENIQFINIKLQHMYGPGDDSSKFTSYVINACKNNVSKLPLTLGEQKRDFIYIDDVVDAYVKILENLTNLNDCQCIELGSGISPRVKDFVRIVHRLTDSKTELLFGQIPYRDHDEMSMVADIEILKNLGWTPKFDIETGVKKILKLDSIK